MAHNIVETATYDAVVPVPDDGDPRTAASVNGALQALADRAAFLNAIIGATGTGAKKIRTVNGTAALKALVGMADGEIAVTNGGFPYASLIWIYSAAGADTEFIPWVVAPTVGGGRWYNTLQAYVNQAGGASGTAARWTLPSAYAPQLPVQTSLSAPGSFTVTPNGVWIDSGAISAAITLSIGDIVMVEASTTLQNNTTTANSVKAALAVLDPTAATTTILGSSVQLSPGGLGIANAIGAAPATMKTMFTATQAGAHQFKIQLFAAAGVATVSIFQPYNFIVAPFRP